MLAAARSTVTTPMTASGKIYYVFSDGFSLITSEGYLDAFTTSSTTYVGEKPYVGETVTVNGTGSWSTSINAQTVTQTNATTTTIPTARPSTARATTTRVRDRRGNPPRP